jgi:predicted enzyme related to lactoylglutathione lyase
METTKVLDGFGVDLFAGIPVNDYQTSLAWYERLFGCPPSFLPNDKEAVWAISEHQWVYIIVEPERAGRSIHTILGNDLEKIIARISERGINFGKEELPAEDVRKVMYYDPDGNEIGFGSVVQSEE